MFETVFTVIALIWCGIGFLGFLYLIFGLIHDIRLILIEKSMDDKWRK